MEANVHRSGLYFDQGDDGNVLWSVKPRVHPRNTRRDAEGSDTMGRRGEESEVSFSFTLMGLPSIMEIATKD